MKSEKQHSHRKAELWCSARSAHVCYSTIEGTVPSQRCFPAAVPKLTPCSVFVLQCLVCRAVPYRFLWVHSAGWLPAAFVPGWWGIVTRSAGIVTRLRSTGRVLLASAIPQTWSEKLSTGNIPIMFWGLLESAPPGPGQAEGPCRAPTPLCPFHGAHLHMAELQLRKTPPETPFGYCTLICITRLCAKIQPE